MFIAPILKWNTFCFLINLTKLADYELFNCTKRNFRQYHYSNIANVTAIHSARGNDQQSIIYFNTPDGEIQVDQPLEYIIRAFGREQKITDLNKFVEHEKK
jgi:hypothetical protein